MRLGNLYLQMILNYIEHGYTTPPHLSIIMEELRVRYPLSGRIVGKKTYATA